MFVVFAFIYGEELVNVTFNIHFGGFIGEPLRILFNYVSTIPIILSAFILIELVCLDGCMPLTRVYFVDIFIIIVCVGLVRKFGEDVMFKES